LHNEISLQKNVVYQISGVRLIAIRERFCWLKNILVSPDRFIVCNSFRGDPKGWGIIGGKKEVSTGRLVHYILAGLMHWPQSRRTHLRDQLPQALTHPVASHTCDIPTQGYTNGEKVYRYHSSALRAEQCRNPRRSRSPIVDRTRWNLTRSAHAAARQKPVRFQAAPRKTSRRNESGIIQRAWQWCSSMSYGMIPRSLRGDSCGYNMQSRLYADLYW